MKQFISHEEISSLCLELSMLIHSGISVADSLTLLSEESDARLKSILSQMAQAADNGETLSSAMRSTGKFPLYVCVLTETGEHTGRLEESLRALADYYENRVRLDRHIRSALLYPSAMLLLMLAIIAVILIKVLPIFNRVYESLGGQLTGMAAILLNLGTLLGKIMPVLWILLALTVVLFAAFAALPLFRAKLIEVWQKKMGDRGLSRKLNNARIAQTLALGTASGLPPEDSLKLAEEMFENIPSALDRLRACRTMITGGTATDEALKLSGLLPPAQCRLLELGQRSGTQDAAMDKIARDLTEESESALEDRVSRIEPTLVLICSLLVGMILLSVMLPLTHIMTMIG